MKDLMLRIANVSSEDDFYRMFPDEASFMKKHGKEFKKAQAGWFAPGAVAGVNNAVKMQNMNNVMQGISSYAPAAGQLVQGIQELKQEKKLLDKSIQNKALGKLMLETSMTRPETQERRYVRPEDNITTGEELYPVYGTAEYGKALPKAQFGMVNNAANKMVSDIITGISGPNGGGRVGGAIGSTIGSVVGGPVGGAIGQALGQTVGTLVNRKPQKIKRNNEETMRYIDAIQTQNHFLGMQDQNFSYMEDGGIAPIMEKKGDLDIHWGGKAKTISKNPFLPDSGETIMFTGQSHDESTNGRTGIGIDYAGNKVEVEHGEPATYLKNAGNEGLVVFGNMKIPKGFENYIGDDRAKGKKFKDYVTLLSKEEKKQTKKLEDNIIEVGEMDSIITPFDKLAVNAKTLNAKGAGLKLKDIASKKEKTAEIQTAMNQLKEEKKLKLQDGTVDPLSRRTVEYDQDGMELLNQQEYLYLMDLYKNAARSNDPKQIEFFQKAFSEFSPNRAQKVLANYPVTNYGKAKDLSNQELESNFDGIFGFRTEQYLPATGFGRPQDRLQTYDYNTDLPEDLELIDTSGTSGEGTGTVEANRRSPLWDVAGQIIPFIRPTNALPLDPTQVRGEMFALSQNQLEPVAAQKFTPELSTPYRLSLQDILNENQVDFRAVTDNVSSPAVQAMMAAEKYKANQKVLGEEFRMNQAMQDSTFRENRAALNDAAFKNLGILDRQYRDQAAAKANTKATTQAALNSISDKILKNQLENRTLQTFENLYNYRFDNLGRAINFNLPFIPNIPTVGYLPTEDEAAGGQRTTDIERKTVRYDQFNVPRGSLLTRERRNTKTPKTKKEQGGVLKAIKEMY